MKKLLQVNLSKLLLLVLLVTGVTSWGQSTLPTAHNLSNSNYILSSYGTSNSNFPVSMAVGTANDGDGSFTNSLTVDAAKGNSNGMWQGEGNNGISYLGGGSNQQGSFLLRTISTGRKDINIVWTVRDITPNTNTNYIELQWRNGTNGAWNEVTNDLYQQGTTLSGTSFNVTLPTSANNSADLRIRWIYYEIGSGNRERLAIDDITVSSIAIPTGPTVVTTAATNITDLTASLNGNTNPAGETVTTYFQYSTDNSYSFTANTSPSTATGNTAINFTAQVTGLLPSTTYNYRAVIENITTSVKTFGAALTFTTAAYTQAPPIAADATDVLNTSFVANWNPINGVNQYELEVSTSPTFSTGGGPAVLTTETFTSAPATGSTYTSTTTWNGVNNITWTANDFRTDIVLNSGGKSVTIRNADETGLTSGSITSGLTKVEFDYRGAFASDTGFITVSVLSGPAFSTVTVIGNNLPYYPSNSPNSNPVNHFNSGVLNITGDYKIRIVNNTPNGRVAIDNIAYTSQSTTMPSFVTGFNPKIVTDATSQIVTGLTPDTNYYYRVRAVNTMYNATSINSNTKPVTTADPFIWTSTGWSKTGEPTLEDEVYIEAAFNTNENVPVPAAGPKTLLAKSLRVTAGTLTVAEQNTLYVVNGITVIEPGALVLENNGTLVQDAATGINTGIATVRRQNAGLYRLDYSLWSSPVEGQNLKDFSPLTKINRFYEYNTTTSQYNSQLDGALDPENDDFEMGKGYLIRMPDTDPTTGYFEGQVSIPFQGEFTGTLYNGNVNITLSAEGNGYNAVGNPYASPIDADTFLDANALSASPVIEGTLYFWRKRNGVESDAYATYTKAGGTNPGIGNSTNPTTPVPNSSIQTGQGFFVKVLPGQGGEKTLFTNAMRETANTGQFFRNGNIAEKHRMWFNFTNPEGLTFQSLVAYMDGATNDIDAAIDGKRFTNNNDGFYSVIEDNQLAIQGRAMPFTTQDEVTMGYKANTAGSYTISLSDKDGLFAQDQTVFVKDNVTGTLHNIKEGAYTFVTEAGNFNNRFTIVYTDAPAMNTNDNAFTANNVVVYKQGSALTINTGKVVMTGVTVYDIQGRAVYTKNGINATEAVITDLQSQQQVLIVQITTPQGKVSKKVVY